MWVKVDRSEKGHSCKMPPDRIIRAEMVEAGSQWQCDNIACSQIWELYFDDSGTDNDEEDGEDMPRWIRVVDEE